MNTFTKITRYLSRALIAASLGLLMVGCSTNINEYADTTPEFDMKTFFNGNLIAYGMVQNRQGKVIRRFHADLVGSW